MKKTLAMILMAAGLTASSQSPLFDAQDVAVEFPPSECVQQCLDEYEACILQCDDDGPCRWACGVRVSYCARLCNPFYGD